MEHVHISTEERRESFVLATAEFLVRGWLDAPDVIAGEIESVGFDADAFIGTARKNFTFAGTRRQFFSLVQRGRKASDVLTDSRLKVDHVA
jgi:hypothetical protein